MKKFLLSMAFIVAPMCYMSAETVTLQIADADNIVGDKVDEQRKDDDSLKEAAKVQPLVSFTVN